MPANRDDALKFIKKKVAHAFRDVNETTAPCVGVSTGCIAADYVTGNGGFPRGKITEVYGVEQSGKTTLCIMACGKAQAQGFYPVYIDVERGLDFPYANKIGFDVPKAIDGAAGLYVAPDTFEEVLLITEKMAEEGKADLIVVDSVAAMVPEQTMKGEITDIGQVGIQARLFSLALPRLVKTIARSNTAVVFVNQLRSEISTGWAPPGAARTSDKTMGGRALKYYSSVRLELVQTKKDGKVVEQPSMTNADRPDKIVVASKHSVFAMKNKVSLPFRKVEFWIRYDPQQDYWGIDNAQTVIDMALAKGLVDQKGSHYLYKGAETMKVQGEEAVYEWFVTHPAAIDEVRAVMGV